MLCTKHHQLCLRNGTHPSRKSLYPIARKLAVTFPTPAGDYLAIAVAFPFVVTTGVDFVERLLVGCMVFVKRRSSRAISLENDLDDAAVEVLKHIGRRAKGGMKASGVARPIAKDSTCPKWERNWSRKAKPWVSMSPSSGCGSATAISRRRASRSRTRAEGGQTMRYRREGEEVDDARCRAAQRIGPVHAGP